MYPESSRLRGKDSPGGVCRLRGAWRGARGRWGYGRSGPRCDADHSAARRQVLSWGRIEHPGRGAMLSMIFEDGATGAGIEVDLPSADTEWGEGGIFRD